MKGLEKYDIDILRLENKTHQFEFSGGDSFFDLFEQDIVEGGNFTVNVTLSKTTDFIRLVLDIQSDLELICDRSLRPFTQKFQSEEKHIYKYGNHYEEVSDDLDIITFGTPKINIGHLLFDYILLQVPMKKLHPDFDSDESEEGLVYEESEPEEDTNEDFIDPRWSALIDLKNKKDK